MDADTGEEVANEDIVKGYKVDTDTFIEVTKEELENVALESTRTIEIDEFVDRSEIDPRYLIRPYYLVPDQRGVKPYRLLVDAMTDLNKVAIGRIVMRCPANSGTTTSFQCSRTSCSACSKERNSRASATKKNQIRRSSSDSPRKTASSTNGSSPRTIIGR